MKTKNRRALQQLLDKSGIRKAMAAREILGPPRSLEPYLRKEAKNPEKERDFEKKEDNQGQ